MIKLLFAFVLMSPATQKTDQQRCQEEADYMAKHRICKHVFGCIGRFEGIGCGWSTPNTRVPSKMRLTGDATARSSSGMTYRVSRGGNIFTR